ncbi:FecCD family ABC transporter permease [Aestuariispira insulae]|uniref:Iron complex transport system permease protein n=1 Tax=Aestuariispira insulae TaxID=1461337 RepID=A0A3D9H5F3_9PROT|nr:iron ABC transporter permease [Aestuariispira insulae]RED44176.1 iron complex transport system permease protein [Aestuariispira insulae]
MMVPAGQTLSGRRESLRPLLLPGLAMALLAGVLASLAIGASSIPVWDVVRVLLSQIGWMDPVETGKAHQELVVLSLRLPRTITALMVGAALGLSGAVLQGVFRNPLADPTLVGVSSGAAFAAAATIVLGGTSGMAVVIGFFGAFALPICAFLGGLATTGLLYRFATRQGRTSVAIMLLAGIAVGALASAGTGMLIFLSNDEQLRDITFWMLGSVGGATWSTTLPLLLLLPVFAGIIFVARPLNQLLLGNREARLIGVNVDRLVRWLIVAVALSVGAAVSVSGIIGFVGIVVPHFLRLITGPDHRFVLPGSMLLGGLLLIVADILARTLFAPAELPIGILTAIMGAPFFLWLLMKMQRRFGD